MQPKQYLDYDIQTEKTSHLNSKHACLDLVGKYLHGCSRGQAPCAAGRGERTVNSSMVGRPSLRLKPPHTPSFKLGNWYISHCSFFMSKQQTNYIKRISNSKSGFAEPMEDVYMDYFNKSEEM